MKVKLKSRISRTLIGGVNLFAIASPMVADELSQQKSSEVAVAQLNAASLKSIESSWLEVPATCKARGFNASPTPLDSKDLSMRAKSVYAALGA